MIHICGRKVKVQTGTKSQTVNICGNENVHGKYDYIIRVRPPFTSEDTLVRQNFSTIEDLVRYLQRDHFGEIERSPISRLNDEVRVQSRTAPPVTAGPADDAGRKPIEAQPSSSWEHSAIVAVEQSIDQFILEFIEFPYLHRVEHSIHCELFNMLTSRRIFSPTYPMGRWVTQPIHKEWPEFLPRPEKGNRRGNFDLCILAPERLRSCSFTEFRQGRVRPSIVIEVGLDYDFAHLSADAAKLKNSGIQESYLVHLVRQEVDDDFKAVEQFLLSCGMKTGYARLTSSRAFYKLVKDERFQSVEIPLAESLA